MFEKILLIILFILLAFFCGVTGGFLGCMIHEVTSDEIKTKIRNNKCLKQMLFK